MPPWLRLRRNKLPVLDKANPKPTPPNESLRLELGAVNNVVDSATNIDSGTYNKAVQLAIDYVGGANRDGGDDPKSNAALIDGFVAKIVSAGNAAGISPAIALSNLEELQDVGGNLVKDSTGLTHAITRLQQAIGNTPQNLGTLPGVSAAPTGKTVQQK
jgi:hypothetical protein